MLKRTILLVLVFSSFPVLSESEIPAPSLVNVCKECHGVEGRAQIPGWPAISSLSFEELKVKLMAYRDNKVSDSRMTDITHKLTDAEINVLAKYYDSLPAYQEEKSETDK